MKHANKFRTIRSCTTNVHLITLLDLVIIPLVLCLIVSLGAVPWQQQYTWWLLIGMITFQSVMQFNQFSHVKNFTFVTPKIHSILWSWLCGLLLLFAINQVQPLILPEHTTYFWLWATTTPILMLGWQRVLHKIILLLQNNHSNRLRIAIVGANKLGYHLRDTLLKNNPSNDSFVGFFDDDLNGEFEKDTQLCGNLQQLVQEAKQGTVNTIYIALPLKLEQKIEALALQLADTTTSVYFIPDLFALDLLRPTLYYIGELPVVSIYDSPFSGVTSFIKRLFDIVVGSMILLIILIPLVLIAVSIKLNSSGPVLFKQRRYGLNGKEIIVWKFRSMTVCEDGATINQATKNDPRVTKLGSFLRKTSLDELPQFINVLQGQMSIVGPRPHAVAHNEWYRSQIQGYMLRHKVKPGITGLAQISGYRGETDTLDKMEGRIRYDLLYIQNWSLWLDVKIILLTIYKGFMSAGAY